MGRVSLSFIFICLALANREESAYIVYWDDVCEQWEGPRDHFIGSVQLFMTPILGPLIVKYPRLNQTLQTLRLSWIVNNATGGKGNDALPFGLWQCNIGAAMVSFGIFVSILVFIIFESVMWWVIYIKECINGMYVYQARRNRTSIFEKKIK